MGSIPVMVPTICVHNAIMRAHPPWKERLCHTISHEYKLVGLEVLAAVVVGFVILTAVVVGFVILTAVGIGFVILTALVV
jgi:hypothetical protein